MLLSMTASPWLLSNSPGRSATAARVLQAWRQRPDEQEESCWEVTAYLLQLVQRALADTALLEIVLRSVDHLLDDLLVDIALLLSISYCDLAYPDRRRGGSQHTTSAFVITATARKKDIGN